MRGEVKQNGENHYYRDLRIPFPPPPDSSKTVDNLSVFFSPKGHSPYMLAMINVDRWRSGTDDEKVSISVLRRPPKGTWYIQPV